jgi:hypothetical protein
MKEIILTLVEADKDALASVRCMPGLQAAVDEGIIWVRGIPAAVRPDLAILQLPSIHTYKLDDENRLFPIGNVTPVGTLKSFKWVPIRDLITIELPTSGMPGRLNEKHQVKLALSSHEEKVDALLTDLQTWYLYAEHAPLVRLKQTHFAVSANNMVLVIGDPLPPLPGKAFSLRNNILLPAGYDFDPPVMGSLIATTLNPSKDSLLLFNIDGGCEQIPLSSLVSSSRSAVRLTKARREHDGENI